VNIANIVSWVDTTIIGVNVVAEEQLKNLGALFGKSMQINVTILKLKKYIKI
jgi:hypothetical protein